jgi:hypothetical protein
VSLCVFRAIGGAIIPDASATVLQNDQENQQEFLDAYYDKEKELVTP